MKKILKSIIVFILAFLARSVLQRYKPRIVMVSGSVGKTSTKDAVAAALGTKFYVRKSEKVLIVNLACHLPSWGWGIHGMTRLHGSRY